MKLKPLLWLILLIAAAPLVSAQSVWYHPYVINGEAGGGAGYETFASFTNQGAANEVLTIELFADNGASLNLNWGPLANCGVGCFAVDLAPGASFTGQTGAQGELVVGYAKVTAGPDMVGAITNTLLGNDVNFPLAMPALGATIPVAGGAQNPTGLIVVNPGTSTANIDLTLRDSTQVIVASTAVVLSAGGRLAQFLTQVFPAMPADFSGSVDAQSDQAAVFAGLRQEVGSGRIIPLPLNVEVSASQGVVTEFQASGNPSPSDTPVGIGFPVGFLGFTVEGLAAGSATEVTLILPGGVVVNTYYKYGPAPDNPTPHWYEFLFDGTTGAEIIGNQVILHFVDGMRGDNDLTENGTIVDPGGPGFEEAAQECQTDTDCDNGVFCDGIESCSEGACVAVSACPPAIDGCVERNAICDEGSDTCLDQEIEGACDDGLFCTSDSCNVETGQCAAIDTCPAAIDGCLVFGACDEENDECLVTQDDSLCSSGETCAPDGQCIPESECQADADCDNGIFCDGIESCSDGACVAVSACPPAIDGCVERNAICDEDTDGCLDQEIEGACEDGFFCTADFCDLETGQCGAIDTCPAAIDGCLVYGACDEEIDQCLVIQDDSLCPQGEICAPDGQCVGNSVYADWKFCSDPNAHNCKRTRGVVPVTLFGSESFDVAQIDFETLELCANGSCITSAYLKNARLEDEGSPDDLGASNCADVHPDGLMDVHLGWLADGISELIGCTSMSKGDSSAPLVIKGYTFDGIPFETMVFGDRGIDQLWIVNVP